MVTAEISEERTAKGRVKEGWYEVVLMTDTGDLHYLRLSREELEAISEAWVVTRDAGLRRIVEAQKAGARQETMKL